MANGYTSVFLAFHYDEDKKIYDFNLYGIETSLMQPLITALKKELEHRVLNVSFEREKAEMGAYPAIVGNQLILKYEK